MRSYISIGRLSETLLLLSSIKAFNCKTFTDVDHLSVSYGINKRAAYDFALEKTADLRVLLPAFEKTLQCGWIDNKASEIEFTDHGNDVISSFRGTSIPASLWRLALYDYISACRPAWSNMIPNGRKEAYLFMTNDEKRCFTEAGLMDSTENDVVNWWDRVALLFRSEKQDILEDIGRDGERKTLAYEEFRTKAKPHWESIDSNYSGFDIMSLMGEDSHVSIFIEVKSSLRCIEDATMIITRNEWDVASCALNINRYFFYLWLLEKDDRLAIIPASAMKKHIPNDTGVGQWKTLEVPFLEFEECFKYV